MAGKTAVHFGAGNIGRGFVAEKLALSGYEVVFVDVMDALISSLQNTKSYKVKEIGGEGEKVNTISNYRAINSKTHEADVINEISTAAIVTCAVGPRVMQFIAPVIAKAIAKRQQSGQPLAVIACENMVNATSALRDHIGKAAAKENLFQIDQIGSKARFANSAIDRIVPAQAPDAGLDVTIESYFEWCVEETPWEPDFKHPDIQAVHWVRDLEPYIERKLYTVNTSHAAAAYYGHNAGIRFIHEAMANKDIRDKVRACVQETSQLIVDKHGISEKEQADYREKILARISNELLADNVDRVGRAPLRKLGLKERFIGPAAPLAAKDMKHSALLGAIEMAFRFQNVEGDEESAELATIMRDNKPAEVVKKVCELKESDKLFNDVVKIVEKVQQS